MPNGRSGDSFSSIWKRMPDSLIILMTSCVVSTRSTFGTPSRRNSSRPASIFLAVQGMMAIWKVVRPSAASFSRYLSFKTVANICMGESAEDRFLMNCGRSCST